MIALLAFSDLLSAKTLEQWKTTIVTIAASVRLKTENWAEGGYTRTLVALFAQLHKTAGDVIRVIAASGFLDTAEEGWLTLLAQQLYGVDRIEATYAKAPNGITLTNTGGGLYILEAGDVVVAHHTSSKTYRNTSGGTLAPLPGAILRLDIEAEEAGADSSAPVGLIDVLVTAFIGITVYNEVALVGLDAESDADLRQRCRDSLALLSSGGIKRAYEFTARSAKRPDGSSVGVTRVLVVPPTGDGTVIVYIAQASGAIDAPGVALVQAEFDKKVTPYGFSATAVSATNVPITAPCTIWIPASLGMSELAARQAVFDALEAYVQTLPIGGVVITPATGRVYWRALLGVIANAIPGTLKAQLASEVDVPLAASEVPDWAGLLADTTVMQVIG